MLPSRSLLGCKKTRKTMLAAEIINTWPQAFTAVGISACIVVVLVFVIKS